MTFDDSQENDQDEASALEKPVSGLGYAADAASGQDSYPAVGGRPSIGQRIVQISRQPMSMPQAGLQVAPELMPDQDGADNFVRRVFPAPTNGAGSTTGLSIGHRILKLNPNTNEPAQKFSSTSFTRSPVSTSGFEGSQKPSIFGSFIPSGDSSFASGNQQANSFVQPDGRSAVGRAGDNLDNRPIVKVDPNAGSKIVKESALPSPKPPKLATDRTQLRRKLAQMMTGIRHNPAMPPMGVAPDGAPMLDITGQVRAPSRIPRQYESGEHFSNINVDLIKGNEGNEVNGYVPPKSGTKESGVTIAAGFDVGQHNLTDLKGFGLPKNLTDKLAPYVDLKGQAAKEALAKNPLTISDDEAKQINAAVLTAKLNAAALRFNESSRGKNFSELPWQAQTAIADLWYNMGDLSDSTVAPVFWGQVTGGDWEGAYRNLRHFSGIDSTLAKRARRDAQLLRDAIDIGWLPSY